jgi:hypothetical protein
VKPATFTAPRLLLGGESLLGVSRAPRDRMLALTARYSDAETLAVTISKALGAGAEGLLVSPSQPLRAALAELKESVPIFALLPNVPEYVRDSSDLGLVGAALKRVKRASPLTLARLGLTGISHALAVLRSDFTGMVPLLLELEAAALDAQDLRAVVLAAPMTDLALAGRHRAFFEHYTTFVRARFGAAAGFETHNLGHLLVRLREWGVAPDLIVGPVNPRGLLMKPSPDELLAALRTSQVPVLAKEVRAAGTVPLLEGARYALDHGAHGVVADLVDLEDLTVELRALKA